MAVLLVWVWVVCVCAWVVGVGTCVAVTSEVLSGAGRMRWPCRIHVAKLLYVLLFTSIIVKILCEMLHIIKMY